MALFNTTLLWLQLHHLTHFENMCKHDICLYRSCPDHNLHFQEREEEKIQIPLIWNLQMTNSAESVELSRERVDNLVNQYLMCFVWQDPPPVIKTADNPSNINHSGQPFSILISTFDLTWKMTNTACQSYQSYPFNWSSYGYNEGSRVNQTRFSTKMNVTHSYYFTIILYGT